MDYVFQNVKSEITDEDVRNLKRKLRIGDRVWVEMESEELVNGALRKKITFKKRKVVKKYPNLVEVQTGSTKRVTLTYKDILVNDLKRKQKSDEGKLG